MVDHAAMNETSLVMALRPELVQMYRLPKVEAGWPVGVGGRDPRVQRMLLIAPSPEHREDLVKQSLEQFEGELYLLHGKGDEIIPYRYSRMFSKAATRAKKVDLVQLIDCGHAFAGEEFQRAFRDAYRKAFSKIR